MTAIKLGKVLSSQSFIGFLGEDKYKKLVKFLLHYIADMDIPIKRCVLLCSRREEELMSACAVERSWSSGTGWSSAFLALLAVREEGADNLVLAASALSVVMPRASRRVKSKRRRES